MEQSLFLGNRRPRLLQVWLLTFCVLLCLRTGADAVKCRKCMPTGHDKPCGSKSKTCEGPFCVMTERLSGQNKNLKIMKFCGKAENKKLCGTETKTGEKLKVHCCETDFCFD
ncbi:Hypothetical predicted protein [Podarcis lilfordi]|uniref:UPAR/Ly6 domain-containing protein n=1 Tax=Podarcis lilfordi TaxID=74358 RepID=A0AA35JXV0_9SAUR|nr:Hypothetical predicted protein [Podarcis lilfordi]